MKVFLPLVGAHLKNIYRDRMSLFWFLGFPILFVFLFGIIFGGMGDSSPLVLGIVFQGGVLEQGGIALCEENPAFRCVQEDLASSLEALKQGKRDVVIVFDGEGIRLSYHPERIDRAHLVAGYIQRFFLEERLRALGAWSNIPPVRLEAVEVPHFRQIDYFLPGVLAMALMQLGLFGSLDFVSLRERKIIRQLGATPLPKRWLLGSEIVVRMIIAFVQTGVIITAGWVFFRVRLPHALVPLFAWILFGSATFVSLGYCLVSLVRTVESAEGIIQMVQFPMMFLSGIFFPPEMMPETLRLVMKLLPLSYFGDALRKAMVDIPTQFGLSTDFLVLLGWLCGSFVLALRFWRWE